MTETASEVQAWLAGIAAKMTREDLEGHYVETSGEILRKKQAEAGRQNQDTPLPCPFCGGAAGNVIQEKRHESGPDMYGYFYRCIACVAVGGWAKTEGNALRNWNRRQ